ncbi:protein of unknown function [Methylocaldum szegediense]|uniref:Transposase n=1 Tax=Methylocaldum szegediense TaxID=73780 RepID=A0ABM9HXP1_9GAMM|nr:protein of unknown function [Methylocaldum szegediense]
MRRFNALLRFLVGKGLPPIDSERAFPPMPPDDIDLGGGARPAGRKQLALSVWVNRVEHWLVGNPSPAGLRWFEETVRNGFPTFSWTPVRSV